jgi:hypothetical protein
MNIAYNPWSDNGVPLSPFLDQFELKHKLYPSQTAPGLYVSYSAFWTVDDFGDLAEVDLKQSDVYLVCDGFFTNLVKPYNGQRKGVP